MGSVHKGQILPIANQMIPIDKETTFHASYDHHLNGFNQTEIVSYLGETSGTYFDGATNIQIKNPLSHQTNLNQEWTVEAWVKLNVGGNATQYLLDGFNQGLWIAHSSNRCLLYLNGGVNDYYAYANANLRDGLWHHIAFVFRNSDGFRQVYMDGKATSVGGPNNTSIPAGIGATVYIGSAVQGFMSELRIWDRVRTQDEIQKGMSKKPESREPNLVAYYKLNEREGVIAYDASDKKNDAVVNKQTTKGQGPTVATLKKEEGKFQGAVLIESDSKNIIKSNGAGANVWGRDTADVTITPTQEESFVFPWSAKWSGSIKSGSGNCYITGGGNIDQVYDTIWTWSCYMKRADGLPIGNLAMYMYGKNAAGASIGNAFPASIESIDCGGGWYRVYCTQTYAEPARFDLVGFSSLDKTTDWYLNGWMLEPRPSRPTSYIPANTSRATGKLWYPKELINPAAFTISCWFNIPYMHRVNTYNTGIQGSWYHPIIELATTINTTPFNGVSIFVGPEPASWSRKIGLAIGGTSNQAGGVAIQDNTWYHAVMTYDGATAKLYIDGVFQNQVVKTPAVITNDHVLMVGGGYMGKPNIMIDELRIESRAISLEEIEAWAASGLHYNFLDYSSYVD